jgi:hypothetical protein
MQFSREQRVIGGTIRLRVTCAVFELHLEPSPKLLKVDLHPVKTELDPDSTSLLS